jgi:hypothetical protein
MLARLSTRALACCHDGPSRRVSGRRAGLLGRRDRYRCAFLDPQSEVATLFIGRVGRDRTFMMTPDDSELCLPSDLAGLTTARYDADFFARGSRRAVGPACTKIRDMLRSIHMRVPPIPSLFRPFRPGSTEPCVV